jgi:histidinol phosphatase-like enzyme (inositol monophosphatase family)
MGILEEELFVFAGELADASGAILKEAAAVVPEVEIKADESPVTKWDKAIEARLREMISARYPDHGILGEEYGGEREDAEFLWVLDPIDGTAPFIAGIPVFGTLIGLVRGGEPLLGLIDHPVTGERWQALQGTGAFKDGRRLRTRSVEDLAVAFGTCSNPDYMSSEERPHFDRLRESLRYLQYGGSCYAYGQLAAGRTDLAVDSGLDVFDYAALIPVIEEAGGIITDWEGSRLGVSSGHQVLAAANRRLHEKALKLLSD